MTDAKVAAKSFLVVRIGKVYDVSAKSYISQDPILEVDKVLQNFESCLFAKFGKKLNLNKIQELSDKTELHLVVVSNVDSRYVSKTYMIKKALNDITPGARNYPPYYQGKEGFIGTWFEVIHSSFQASLADLYVASSYKKLLTSMASSMSSFFFCKL